MWFSSFGCKILCVNSIVWFFYIKDLQNGLIFWLHYLRNSSASWLKPTEQNFADDRFYDSLWVSFEVKLVLFVSSPYKSSSIGYNVEIMYLHWLKSLPLCILHLIRNKYFELFDAACHVAQFCITLWLKKARFTTERKSPQ